MDMKKLILSIASGFLFLFAHAQIEKGNMLIKNGTVLTITKGNLDQTDVLVKDGRIIQIGKNVRQRGGFAMVPNFYST